MATPINVVTDFTGAVDATQFDFSNMSKKLFTEIIAHLVEKNTIVATTAEVNKVQTDLNKVQTNLQQVKGEVGDVKKDLNDFKSVPADNLKKVKLELAQAQKDFLSEGDVKRLIKMSGEVQETLFNSLLDDIKRDTKRETEEVVHELRKQVAEIKRIVAKHESEIEGLNATFVDKDLLKQYMELCDKSLSSLKTSFEKVNEFVIQVESMANARDSKFKSLADFANHINAFTEDAAPLLDEVFLLRDYVVKGKYASIVESYKDLCVKQCEMRSQSSSKGNDRCRQSKKMSGSSGNSFARRYNSQGTDQKRMTPQEEMKALLNSF
jgi:hypothetical protein